MCGRGENGGVWMPVRTHDFLALVMGTGLLAGMATARQEQSLTPGGAPVTLSKKEKRKQEKKLRKEGRKEQK